MCCEDLLAKYEIRKLTNIKNVKPINQERSRMKQLIVFCTLLCAVQCYAAENTARIEVYGRAQKKVVPNEMHWHLQVKTTGKEIAGVAKEHLNNVNAILECLQKNAIDKKEITTARMQLQEKWEYRREERVQDGYIAATSINFLCRKMEAYIPLWQELSERGHVEIDGVDFAVADIEKIQEELKAAALTNAKEKAEKMAGILGEKLGRPLLIQDSSTPSFSGFRSKGYASDAGGGQVMIQEDAVQGDAVSAGEQLVSTSVFVVFALTEQ